MKLKIILPGILTIVVIAGVVSATTKEKKQNVITKAIGTLKVIAPIVKTSAEIVFEVPTIIRQTEAVTEVMDNVKNLLEETDPDMTSIMEQIKVAHILSGPLFKSIRTVAPKISNIVNMIILRREPTQEEIDKITHTITGFMEIIETHHKIFEHLAKQKVL